MRLFRELLPPKGEPAFPRRFDLLIVDEAHNVAPAGRNLYALDSHRTDAIRTIAPHFEHRLFLSATPHNGYPESFTALLELLDDQRFQRGVRPDPRQLAAIMVRRLKSEIVDWAGKPKFPKRELIALEVPYADGDRKPLTLWQLHERLWGACRRAGLREIRWQDLRHTFASQLVSAGVPLRQVQDWLGHSTMAMTMRYAHLVPGQGADLIQALEDPATVAKAWQRK